MSTKTRWQYCIARKPDMATPEEMNELGAMGWELVSHTVTAQHLGGTSMHYLTFKRPAHDPA